MVKPCPFRTEAQSELIDASRRAEEALYKELTDLEIEFANKSDDYSTLQADLLQRIKEKRAEAANKVAEPPLGSLIDEAEVRAERQAAKQAETVENVRERYSSKRQRLSNAHKAGQNQNTRSINAAMDMVEMWNVRSGESVFLGSVADEGVHVYRANGSVKWDNKSRRMVYMDEDGQLTSRDVGGVVEADGLMIDLSEGSLEPVGLPGAYRLQQLNQLTPDEASSVLNSIDRLAKTFADSDLGFHQEVLALADKAIPNKFGERLTPGARGGQNLAGRIYTDILNNILFENRHAALLRSPGLQNKFSRWLNDKLKDTVVLDPRVRPKDIAKDFEAGVAKVVSDFTYPRTKGTRYIEADPVWVLEDGSKVKTSEFYAQFMDEQSKINPNLEAVAKVEALDTFRQQMLNKVEEAAVTKWFYEQVGTPGWFDKGISVRYMTDIAEYMGTHGHLPPVLKHNPHTIQGTYLHAPAKKRMLTGETVDRGVSNKSLVESELANRLMAKDPELSLPDALKQAKSLVDEMDLRLTESLPGDPSRFEPLGPDILPSLDDRGAAAVNKMERGAGLVRWKQPIQTGDMASWAQVLNLTGEGTFRPHINTELGGAGNSTLGWLFMANRTMNQGGFLHGLRQISSAIKRNLTTQRPQTALTNYMSNYLAMMTRDGLMPQEAAAEIMSAANLWRTYARDPSSLMPAQRARIKAMFDRGIASNNAVNVDANIVMDSFQSNPMMKPVDWYATGLRRIPGIGKIMEGMDWAYQAGDGIFKMVDSLRAARRMDGWVDQLSPNNSIQFMDASQGNKVIGTAWKTADGALEVKYRGKKYTGKEALAKLEEMKMDAAVGYANGLYFDYARVPGFIELARNFDAIAFGPFKTWAWKSLDIPFLKRGMGTRALFGDVVIQSTDPRIMSSVYLQQAGTGMRKAALLALVRDTTGDDDYLRKLIPEWLAPGAFFDDHTTTFQSMGNRNFVINLSNMTEAAYKITRGTEEDILMAKLRKKEKPPFQEIAKLILSDGIVYSTLMELAEGETSRGEPLDSGHAFYQHFANKLMPGWIYSGGETLMTVFDDMAPYTGLARANRFRDDKTRMDTASYMMKIWTGRRLEYFDEETIEKVMDALAGVRMDGTEIKEGSLLDRWQAKQLKDDLKEWEALHGKDGLKDYKVERTAYWKEQKNKLRSSFKSMRKDFEAAWRRKKQASKAFRDSLSKGKKTKTKSAEELRRQLMENQFFEESADRLQQLGQEDLDTFVTEQPQ